MTWTLSGPQSWEQAMVEGESEEITDEAMDEGSDGDADSDET